MSRGRIAHLCQPLVQNILLKEELTHLKPDTAKVWPGPRGDDSAVKASIVPSVLFSRLTP